MYTLLSNAFKYRSPDRDCQILVRTGNMGGYTLLLVKDKGLGLNEKNKEQLFSMFKRFHSHTEGTGIGLCIVKRIMDNAGGRIEAESTEAEGPEFKVFFRQNTFTHEKQGRLTDCYLVARYYRYIINSLSTRNSLPPCFGSN